MTKVKSWEVTDKFWRRVETLIPQRQRVASQSYSRKVDGAASPKTHVWCSRQSFMFYVQAANGKLCPLKGSEVPVRYMPAFLEWEKAGVFENLWRLGLAEYDELQGITWRWQSIDSAIMKAPIAQESVGANPTDRGEKMGANVIDLLPN